MSKTYTHNYTGKNLLELKDKFGVGSSGFYDSDWWLKEGFASETPPQGKYEIDLGENLVNLTLDEQVKKLKNGFEPIHPAILVEFILTDYRNTGRKLLEYNYTRTSSLGSHGRRVPVGDFDDSGLYIAHWDDRRRSMGLAASRSSKKLETGSREHIEGFDLSDIEIRIKGREYKLNEY